MMLRHRTHNRVNPLGMRKAPVKKTHDAPQALTKTVVPGG